MNEYNTQKTVSCKYLVFIQSTKDKAKKKKKKRTGKHPFHPYINYRPVRRSLDIYKTWQNVVRTVLCKDSEKGREREERRAAD